MKCLWCHNPESISFHPQLAYYANKCMGCGECVSVCPVNAHRIDENGHTYHRDLCIHCGKCEEVCLGRALTLYGREMSVEELLPLLLEDRGFYTSSGGGVTLSGGECLCHADFCAELLRRLKEQGIHTAVDTCGFVPREAIDKVLPYTDTFLFDVKAADSALHKKCTGHPNELILDNLHYIDSQGKDIEVRIPYVPEYNAGDLEQIGQLLSGLKHLIQVRLLPYHNLAGSKYEALEMANTLPAKVPSQQEMESAAALLRRHKIRVAL